MSLEMTWTVSFRMKNKPDLFQQNLYFKLNLNLEPTGIRLRGGGQERKMGRKEELIQIYF